MEDSITEIDPLVTSYNSIPNKSGICKVFVIIGITGWFLIFGLIVYYMRSLYFNEKNQTLTSINQKKNLDDKNESTKSSNLSEGLNKVLVKSYEYNNKTISVYTFKKFEDNLLDSIYVVTEGDLDALGSIWKKNGVNNWAIITTKHPFYGDDSFIDIVGNDLVAIDAMSRSINIYKINSTNDQFISFSINKTFSLPEKFSGVPYNVKCNKTSNCIIYSAWHSQGGCSGNLSLETGQFEKIQCGEGYR